MDLIYNEENFKNIFLVAISVVSENRMIGLEYNAKRLYEMDLLTGKIKYLSEIPIEQKSEIKLYHKSVLYNNRLYFLPFNCSTIAVFDLRSNDFEMINIPSLDLELNWQIINAYVEDNNILMIPYQGGKFIRFNMDTHQMVEYFDFSNMIGEDLLCPYDINEEGALILPSMTSNKIFIMNIFNNEISVIQASEEICGFSGVAVHKKCIWLVLKNKFGILKYDTGVKKWTINDECPKWFYSNGNTCFDAKSVFCSENKLVCPPAFANTAIIINLENGEISEFEELHKYADSVSNDNTRFTFDGSCESEDVIYLCYQEHGIVEVDLKSKKCILHRFDKNIMDDCLRFLLEKAGN